MDVEIIYTDAAHEDAGVLSAYELDMDEGDTDDFTLKVYAGFGPKLQVGSWVYADGMEYGGRVDSMGVDTSDGSITYVGRTWRGMLAERVLRPPSGQTHYSWSGDANAALGKMLEASAVVNFRASTEVAGVTVSGDADRYCTVADGMDKMLGAVGMRLGMAHGEGGTVLSAVGGYTEDAPYEASSDECDISAEGAVRVNHLVCLGTDTGTSRVLIDLYADAAGSVSQRQSLFGEAEVEETYEYTTEDADQLLTDGTKKLKDLQKASEASMRLSTGTALALHDVVRLIDERTGITATGEVSRKVLRVNRYGVSYEYTMDGVSLA